MVRSFPVPGGLFSPPKPSPEAFFRSVSRSVFQTPFLPAETGPRSRSGKPRPRRPPKISRRSRSRKFAQGSSARRNSARGTLLRESAGPQTPKVSPETPPPDQSEKPGPKVGPKVSPKPRSRNQSAPPVPEAGPGSPPVMFCRWQCLAPSDGPRRRCLPPRPIPEARTASKPPQFCSRFQERLSSCRSASAVPPFSGMPHPPSAAKAVFSPDGKIALSILHMRQYQTCLIPITCTHAAAGIFRRHENNNQGDVSLSCRQKFAVPIFFCSAIHAGSYPISTLLLPLFLRNPKVTFCLSSVHCSLNEKIKKSLC